MIVGLQLRPSTIGESRRVGKHPPSAWSNPSMSSDTGGPNESGVECPSCDDEFDTEYGRNIHHARVHDESLTRSTVQCTNCDESITRLDGALERADNHFCSNDCQAAFSYNGWIETECARCDVAVEKERWRVERYDNVFCSVECSAAFKSEHQVGKTGPDSPVWVGRVTVECEQCDETIRVRPKAVETTRFCSQPCRSAWMVESGVIAGENSPFWKGGRIDHYGASWPRQRASALERDEYRCQHCGMTREEHTRKYGNDLHVHHIVPFRTFDSSAVANQLSNLVVLCRPHHVRWEAIPGLRPA